VSNASALYDAATGIGLVLNPCTSCERATENDATCNRACHALIDTSRLNCRRRWFRRSTHGTLHARANKTHEAAWRLPLTNQVTVSANQGLQVFHPDRAHYLGDKTCVSPSSSPRDRYDHRTSEGQMGHPRCSIGYERVGPRMLARLFLGPVCTRQAVGAVVLRFFHSPVLLH
jgi:hypothetical protein